MSKETFIISARSLLPLLSSILLLLFSYTPLDLIFMNNIKPMVGIICVFFWVSHRPDLFNLGSVVVLSCIESIISNSPWGMSLFTLLLIYVIVSKFQKFLYNKPFAIFWYSFMLLALISTFSKWFLLSVYYTQILPILPIFFSYLITIAFYPFISIINGVIQNSFLGEE